MRVAQIAWMALGVAIVGAYLATSSGAGDESETMAGSATPEVTLDPSSVDPASSEPAAAQPVATQPVAPVPTSPPSTVPPPRAPIVLGFAGDSSFTNGLDQRDPFGGVTDLLTAYDFMLINLETAVADADVGRAPVPKQFLFRSPPQSLDLLQAAGVDAVALGNNHTRDFGPDAVVQTLDELDARSILRTGGGRDQAESYEPIIAEVGEWKVGIHSFSRVPCDWSASGENVRPETAWACPPFLDLADQAIASIADEVDVSVVMVHGGTEGVLCPSDFMLELNQHWAELGVDVVINGHPHVVQGVTVLDGGTLVALSTGNFAFPPARGVGANSVVVELDVAEEGLAMTMRPIRADGGVLRIPSDAEGQAILDQISDHSFGARLDTDGRVIEDPQHQGLC